MVNKKQIRKKLPLFLVDGPLTEKRNLYDYQNYRRKIDTLARKKPHFLNQIERMLMEDLEDLERALMKKRLNV